MKRGVMLVNTSRGTLVNTGDLVAALESGHISAAALDVVDPEPIPADSPLLKMDNVILHSHVAANSVAARNRLRTSVAEAVARAVRGKSAARAKNGDCQPLRVLGAASGVRQLLELSAILADDEDILVVAIAARTMEDDFVLPKDERHHQPQSRNSPEHTTNRRETNDLSSPLEPPYRSGQAGNFVMKKERKR